MTTCFENKDITNVKGCEKVKETMQTEYNMSLAILIFSVLGCLLYSVYIASKRLEFLGLGIFCTVVGIILALVLVSLSPSEEDSKSCKAHFVSAPDC